MCCQEKTVLPPLGDFYVALGIRTIKKGACGNSDRSNCILNTTQDKPLHLCCHNSPSRSLPSRHETSFRKGMVFPRLYIASCCALKLDLHVA